MGKQNFSQLYIEAERELGYRPKVKLSHWCDRYKEDGNFAGMIIYNTYGSHKWKQRVGQGVSGGHRGQSFYVLILCTDEWPESVKRAVGQGRVHDYLYERYFAMSFAQKRTCCGGFAVRNGQLCTSSIWLNMQEGSVHGREWKSDGSKYLSRSEKYLVMMAAQVWAKFGPGRVIPIPDQIDYAIRNNVSRAEAPGDADE